MRYRGLHTADGVGCRLIRRVNAVLECDLIVGQCVVVSSGASGQKVAEESVHHCCCRGVMRVYGCGVGSEAGSETQTLFNQPAIFPYGAGRGLMSRVSFFK